METQEQTSFGCLSILLHWVIAVLCFGLFALGWWMVELDYNHPWYQVAPWLHKLFGTLLLFLLILRFFWTLLSPPPAPLTTHKKWEKAAARHMHHLLNLLILIICITGNIMILSTGDSFSVFGTFNLSDTLGVDNLEDIAGEIHLVLACLLMGLVLLHVLAAFKHHFLDKDRTLRRIFGL